MSHPPEFYATKASVKGVNCTMCGREIACVSRIANASNIVSVCSIARVHRIASASTVPL